MLPRAALKNITSMLQDAGLCSTVHHKEQFISQDVMKGLDSEQVRSPQNLHHKDFLCERSCEHAHMHCIACAAEVVTNVGLSSDTVTCAGRRPPS